MKVLCIVDSLNWALANRANALKKYYSTHIFDIKHFNAIQKVNFNNYDIVYSLNWPIHGYVHSKYKGRKFRLVTSISSHIGQPSNDSFGLLLKQYDAVSVSNKHLLKDIGGKFPDLNLYYTPFGVDSKLFTSTSKPSTNNNVFGWVGNKSRDVKRFDIISDIFKNIKNGKLKVADQNSNYSREQMAKFYNDVGTVICFSKSEGTPNPILEAASCGRSIISSDVGNVSELISGSNSIQLVKTRIDLEKAIQRNIASPHLTDSEGQFLRSKVEQSWDWDIQSKKFKVFLGL